MTDEERYMMLAPNELVWPITWRYTVRAGWGLTQQELTVECPQLAGKPGASKDLGLLIWGSSLALASTTDVSMLEWSTICWRGDAIEIPDVALGAHGAQGPPGTDRANSGQLVLHTGHLDTWARRRLPLPSLPVGWVNGRRLSFQGWNALLTLAEGMIIGLQLAQFGGPYQQLIAYDGLFEPSLGNFRGVAFRRVMKVRVCQDTDRAPEPPGGL